MERATPARSSHTSTADLLTWSETPQPGSPAANAPRSSPRSQQGAGGVGKVLFGGQITDEEAESLNRRRVPSDYKLKEMTGSKIFASESEGNALGSGNGHVSSVDRTSVRIVQQATKGVSQISFSTEERISPKKPTSIPEVAKQRELSGTLENEGNAKAKKQISNAKSKELSGNDIFGPPTEAPPPRSLAAARSVESKESKEIEEPAPRMIRTSVKVSNPAGGQSNIMFGEEPVVKTSKKIHNQKFAELTGNDIFKGDVFGSSEKSLSQAKLKEMSGSNIFADGKVEARDHLGGVRKPPGGESTIALI